MKTIGMVKGAFVVACAGMAVTGLFFIGASIGERVAENEVPESIEAVPPALPTPRIEVDGVGCVISEEPVLTYYKATESVRLNIECDVDVLYYYLPAQGVEVIEGGENSNAAKKESN